MPNDLISNRPAVSPLARRSADKLAAARARGPAPVFEGHSSAARKVRRLIQKALGVTSAVLVVGAPGTGKRTVAEILHHFGGGETSSLTHVKLGAGSGVNTAVNTAMNALKTSSGFVFISPIEQLSLDQQAKIREEVGLNRLILGTRLDPDSPEAKARLSPQLLRWCSVRIDLPTLVERIDDVEALVLALLHRLPTTRPVGAISDTALDSLRVHDWPGNVSELEAVIIKALAAGCTGQIELRDLPPELRVRDAKALSQSAAQQQFALAMAERRAVERVMRLVRGNKRLAARMLQIGKTTLYRRLSDYDK